MAATGTLTITGAQQTNEGTYRLTATNGLGGAVSEGATLAVVPVLVWGASDGPPAGTSNAVQIACGQWHNTALRADGRVVAWGWDSSGQSTVPESATNVIAPDIYRNKAGDQFADCLLVRLPKNVAKRKAIRRVCLQLRKRNLGAVQPDEDIGETHLYLYLA